MHTRIPRSNTSIELGRTHRRHHGTIVANEIARSQPHWRCVREVAGKRNTRGTSVSLLSRNGIVPIRPYSSIEHQQHFSPNRNSTVSPPLPCYAPSFSFFTIYLTLRLHSRDPYTPNKGGHTDVNIYELCITVTVFQALFNIDIGRAPLNQITLHVVSSFSSSTITKQQVICHSLSIRDTDRSVPPIGSLDEPSPTITMHPLLVGSEEIVHAR